MKSRNLTGFLLILTLCSFLARYSWDTGSSSDENLPVVLCPQGKRVHLGMSRALLVETLGPPPEGYDYGTEMLWEPGSNVWRCFLEDDCVVAIQVDALYRSGRAVVNSESSKAQILEALGSPLADGEQLIFPRGGQSIAVQIEPDMVGHTLVSIGIFKDGFDPKEFNTWARPIPEMLSERVDGDKFELGPSLALLSQGSGLRKTILPWK